LDEDDERLLEDETASPANLKRLIEENTFFFSFYFAFLLM